MAGEKPLRFLKKNSPHTVLARTAACGCGSAPTTGSVMRRIRRAIAASACVLMYATGESGRVSETARERLRAMVETSDGFEIARRDLEIRGPGEFLGARQSGAAMLRFADLAVDIDLLEWARALAPRMLDQYPELAERHVQRWLGGKSDFLKA